MDILKEIGIFIFSVFGYWEVYALGGCVVIIMWVWKKVSKKPFPKWAIKHGLLAFLVVAVFMAWQDQYHKVQELEAEAEPKLEISKTNIMAKSRALIRLSDDRALLKILVGIKNISTRTVRNVEVKLKEVNVFGGKLPWGMGGNLWPLYRYSANTIVNINPGDTVEFVVARYFTPYDEYPVGYIEFGDYKFQGKKEVTGIISVSAEDTVVTSHAVTFRIHENANLGVGGGYEFDIIPDTEDEQ